MGNTEKMNERRKSIAEQITILRRLSSNDSKERTSGMRQLRILLKNFSPEHAYDEMFDNIWKGLFIYLWASDKPLNQERAAEAISSLIAYAGNTEFTCLFVRSCFKILTKQWLRISHHRTEKFLMFVRRFLRKFLQYLANSDWEMERVKAASDEFYACLQTFPFTLTDHFNDIFGEEVAKVSEGMMKTENLVALYDGFARILSDLKPNMQVVNSVQLKIFISLGKQLKLYLQQLIMAKENGENIADSDNRNGNDDEENDVLSVENDISDDGNVISDNGKDDEENDVSGDGNDISDNGNDDTEEKLVLDPRPGKVDVVLPFVDFDENKFVLSLRKYSDASTRKGKNVISTIITMFERISEMRKKFDVPYVEKIRAKDNISNNELEDDAREESEEEMDSESAKKRRRLN